MSSRTVIINRALVRVGANTIASPDEDTEQARKAKAVFDGLARAEMRRQAWSFALKRATLALLADAPVSGFGSAYNLPGDCLRVVSVNGNWLFNSIREVSTAPEAAYAIEGRTLVSNDRGAAQLRYVADMVNAPASWDATFEDAFVYRLAAEITPSITKNLQLRSTIMDDYKMALKEARRTNAIELPPQAIPDDSWVASRYW